MNSNVSRSQMVWGTSLAALLALAETEMARALDPTAKQLLFNLAVVHEKLGEIDAAGVGTFFAVRAAADRPSHFIAGVDGTFAEFQRRNAAAHREAIVADVALGAGIAASAITVYLAFGRSHERATSVSFAPLTGGGGLLVSGWL